MNNLLENKIQQIKMAEETLMLRSGKSGFLTRKKTHRCQVL